VQDFLKAAVRPEVLGPDVGLLVRGSDLEELRGARMEQIAAPDSVPFDLDYTRDLGYCAAKYLIEGGDAVMVSLPGGQFVPVPFAQLLDPKTGRARRFGWLTFTRRATPLRGAT
jgi:hypothetical protein